MRLVTARRHTALSLASILGILCIVLVLVTGVVHVAHFHANGQLDQDCSLCITAHQAVQVAAIVVVILCSQPVVHRVAERIEPAPRQRFVQQLANRPPPVPDFA